MRIKGRSVTISKIFLLIIYYTILFYLPSSICPLPFVGNFSRKLRFLCCKKLFKYCGSNVNVERKVKFGSGLDIEIGDNSGIGVNATIPSDTKIGKNVMMGPNCYILHSNHSVDRVDIPMIDQGFSENKQTIIEDDVWIGRDVLMTPGRLVKKGSIIAAGCVLCKNFPEYSIIGGNPSRLIKSRV